MRHPPHRTSCLPVFLDVPLKKRYNRDIMEAERSHYILIDHENIPTLDLGDIGEPSVKVLVFLGKQTTKLPVGDVQKLMACGGKVQLVLVSGQGKNALDFHIAYYIGRITTQDSAASIHVVSKDTGFDPLIAHLRQDGKNVQRSVTVPRLASSSRKKSAENEVPLPEPVDLPIEQLIAILTKNAKARPRKRKTLASSITSHFKQLSLPQVDALIDVLVERGKIAIDAQGAVTYHL